jgi:uncharacterized coiled-coil protein SlyX
MHSSVTDRSARGHPGSSSEDEQVRRTFALWTERNASQQSLAPQELCGEALSGGSMGIGIGDRKLAERNVDSSVRARERRTCIGFRVNDARRMDSELAERLKRLESTIAHLEHMTELLNEVVTEQGRELVQLKKKYLLQSESLDTIELERIRSTNPKPPHYG